MSNQLRKPGIPFNRLAQAAVLLLGVTFCLWAGSKMYKAHKWRAEFDRGRAMIGSLENRGPQGANQNTWKYVAFPWATHVYGEAFSNPFNTDLGAMQQFNDALEEKLNGEVAFDVFDWIWEELGRATPAGKYYHDRFGPHYRETLEAVRKQAGKPEPVMK